MTYLHLIGITTFWLTGKRGLNAEKQSVHPIYFGFHRMLSKRFPFGIYYEIEVDVVYVNALAAWQNTKQSRQTHHSPPFAPNLANLAVL